MSTEAVDVQMVEKAVDSAQALINQQAEELRKAKAELAEAVDVVRDFVSDHDNRLGPSVERLRDLLIRHDVAHDEMARHFFNNPNACKD